MGWRISNTATSPSLTACKLLWHNTIIQIDKCDIKIEEVIVTNKQESLICPFGDILKLTNKKCWFHCDNILSVSDSKVFKGKKGNKFICCLNAQNCDGIFIDWFRAE